MLSKFLCCCRTTNPLEECRESTLIWKTMGNNSIENKDNFVIFDKEEIRLYGLFNESIKNKPLELKSFTTNEIQKITSGKNHSLVLMKDNKVGVWGSNQNGQLGLNRMEVLVENLKINNLDFISNISMFKVVDIACGNNSSYLLLTNVKNKTSKIIQLGEENESYSSHSNSIHYVSILVNIKL